MMSPQLEDYYFFKNFAKEWREICEKLKKHKKDLSEIVITCKSDVI